MIDLVKCSCLTRTVIMACARRLRLRYQPWLIHSYCGHRSPARPRCVYGSTPSNLVSDRYHTSYLFIFGSLTVQSLSPSKLDSLLIRMCYCSVNVMFCMKPDTMWIQSQFANFVPTASASSSSLVHAHIMPKLVSVSTTVKSSSSPPLEYV